MDYQWVLVFHILSFISWMAMLFYLPRLFVYHAENINNQGFCDVVLIQEKKLYQYIGIPALWGTLLSGSYMLFVNSSILSSGGWMHVKIAAIILLIIYSYSLGIFIKRFAQGDCKLSGRFFRIYNEIPTILAIVIVIMVIIKPF